MRTLIKLAIVLSLLALYTHWDELTLKKNDLGFSPVIMPDGANADDIIIYISPGYSDRDKRGRLLFKQLKEKGLPVKTSARYFAAHQYNSKKFDEKMKKTFVVLEGKGLVVLVGGVGKVNPTLEDIVTQHERNKSRAN